MILCRCGTQAEERWLISTKYWFCPDCRVEVLTSSDVKYLPIISCDGVNKGLQVYIIQCSIQVDRTEQFNGFVNSTGIIYTLKKGDVFTDYVVEYDGLYILPNGRIL